MVHHAPQQAEKLLLQAVHPQDSLSKHWELNKYHLQAERKQWPALVDVSPLKHKHSSKQLPCFFPPVAEINANACSWINQFIVHLNCPKITQKRNMRKKWGLSDLTSSEKHIGKRASILVLYKLPTKINQQVNLILLKEYLKIPCKKSHQRLILLILADFKKTSQDLKSI